jgi:hypothetical protein
LPFSEKAGFPIFKQYDPIHGITLMFLLRSPPMAVNPVLNNPLQSSTSTFSLGVQSTFQVTGSNFTSSNVTSVIPSSTTTGISWTFPTNNFTVVDANTISLLGTPNQSPGPPGGPTGDLTVTINKGQPNQSSASANNISYNAARARR